MLMPVGWEVSHVDARYLGEEFRMLMPVDFRVSHADARALRGFRMLMPVENRCIRGSVIRSGKSPNWSGTHHAWKTPRT